MTSNDYDDDQKLDAVNTCIKKKCALCFTLLLTLICLIMAKNLQNFMLAY